ncbi:MAG: pyrroline-5-carboxylate reductase [Gammaproteobacteria bacterium]|nr:pyrroline-5-carboxylate reductase [Gammaproteobacteria bacterium]
MSSRTIAFIGGGNMAGSLIGGLVADGYNAAKIYASDADREKLASLSARFGIRSASDNLDAAKRADVVVLAVKPQVMKQVAKDLVDAIQQNQPLVISIAAGVREANLQQWLGSDVALIRTMPNTPAMLQAGATVLHAGKGVTSQQKSIAETIMRSVGLTCWVDDEALMDTVTALSGSGPAYFFLVMEAMEQAGTELGLPADTARLLTLQTALGAARMAMERAEGPATLRSYVTSPGGTTESALKALEAGRIRDIFRQALGDAKERSEEISAMLGND